jgi:hypothetical protein
MPDRVISTRRANGSGRWPVTTLLALIVALSFVGCSATNSSISGPIEPAPGSGSVAPVSPLRWSAVTEGYDGVVITNDAVVVISPEVITAYELASGRVRWQSDMSDTSGWTPALVVGGVLVVAPPHEEVQAFDLVSGEAVRAVPPYTLPPTFRRELPEGYAYADGALTYRGQTLRTNGGDSALSVGRVGNLTVVNDLGQGLKVLDDQGKLLVAPLLGFRQFDEGPVIVQGDIAVTATSDGVLHLIRS